MLHPQSKQLTYFYARNTVSKIMGHLTELANKTRFRITFMLNIYLLFVSAQNAVSCCIIQVCMLTWTEVSLYRFWIKTTFFVALKE